MNMIVAYDITDEKRLTRVAKVMLDYGIRVQKSIFEISATNTIFQEMKRRVEKIIVAEQDGVKYFPLCERCAGTVEIIGQGQFTDPDSEYYVY
ncbi:MAG TPA: CRISPR-associated endonuclease Cas2 [Smithellaceae bacterium]|nr:CRISPR-associated endonuclease Cas2 [Smithellaceae bacterium]HRV43702.1 CRISPR-associated endonuclease Cas2 [Smithellaceae bacterium]